MIVRRISYIICLSLLTFSSMAQTFKKTVDGNNIFAFEIFKKVFNKDYNTLLSPYSISSALAMTYAGARNETEKQMKSVLHFDPKQINTHKGFFAINSSLANYTSDTLVKLSLANALWKSQSWSIKSDYLDLTEKYYNAAVFPLTGAKAINDWADKNTNGKIKEIVQESDLENVRMVLTNAIYFKGNWVKGFKEDATSRQKFKITPANVVDVDMMFQANKVNYFEDAQNQVIELPYKGESISMTIILPKETSSIENLSTGINNQLMTEYNSKMSKREVKIYIPKFTFTSQFHLENVLPVMGMTDAFNPGKADFSGMSKGLSISAVIHKAFIEVNEKGTEAAAVTAVTIRTTSFEPEQKEITFKADRPFLILISEKKTGSILFVGSVINPNEKGK